MYAAPSVVCAEYAKFMLIICRLYAKHMQIMCKVYADYTCGVTAIVTDSLNH